MDGSQALVAALTTRISGAMMPATKANDDDFFDAEELFGEEMEVEMQVEEELSVEMQLVEKEEEEEDEEEEGGGGGR